MKKRLLSAFLAVMMVLTMAPVAFAADDAENTVGDTGSGETTPAETLQAKIKVAAEKDGTVTLDKDYTEDITIQQGQNITLNLNRKKLTNKTGHTITVEQGATLTINGEGTVDNVTHAKSALVNYGEVVLDNGVTLERSSEKGTLSPYSNGGNSYYTILNDKGATMTIKDATVENSGGYSSAIRNGGDSQCDKESSLTINDGNFSGGLNAVKNDELGILTINGGAFSNSSQYVVMNWHKAIINAGTFSAKESSDAVLQTASYDPVRGVGKLEITGGTFKRTGTQDMIYPDFIDGNGKHYPGTASITGGTFSSDVSAYCDANYATEKNTDNTYTVKPLKDVAVAKIDDTYYKTLADAVAAAQNGATITLLKDTIGSGIGTYENPGKDLQGNDQIAAKGFTIDFNQHTYSVDKPAVGSKGYETQGFHLEWKGAVETTPDITLKNGTLNVAQEHDPNLKLLVQNYCNLTLDNMTVDGTNLTKGWGSYTYVTSNCNGTVTIKDSVIISENPNADVAFDVDGAKPITSGFYGPVKLTIEGNSKISGKFEVSNKDGNSLTITGGYFTTDPSDYVASGYVAGTSDVSGYSYKVVKKTETGNVEVKPAVAKPEVKVDKIPQKDQETVKAAAATVSAPTLGAAAVDEAQKIDKSKADELVKNANEVAGNTADKKLYVQSALKVEPTAYDAANKTLALEITPQYRVVASTATTADEIKLDGNTKNAQVVQDYQTMDITKATVVTMELPTGFAVADGDKLSIQHTKNGTVEYYTGTVTKKDDKFYLTFTTNGFSPFVISVPAASIGENVYPTLQAAADAAKSTDVISVKSGASHELNFTTTKSVKVKNDTGVAITVKFNGTNKDVAKDATETFSYTKPSSSSSGGSSSGKTTYKVTTSAVNNGGASASPSNAEKGATITITLSPDKGYKLDKLTVTDGSGKSVSTVKKSDTVYTFTMPASAVTVGVSYAKADETPSKTTFNDVSANDWFASAVDYVTGKGMMNGTAANTFSPKANTTRGMLMTVLARHAGEDTTGGSVWYEKGMNWAKANGVSDGTNPQVNITREQLAAMLYRYAQNKKYDVSGAKSLDGYTDAQSVSSYAVPAIQWACGAGVMNGKSGSKLDPKGYATRAEVAAMLMRFCENVEK